MRPSFPTLTAGVAGFALAAAAASGPHRRAALLGSAIASLTAVASMLLMARSARSAKKPVQGALLVMTVMFLARIVLVALGTAVVARGGESVFGFVLGFFVPYFAFMVVEGAYVHALRRPTGPTT